MIIPITQEGSHNGTHTHINTLITTTQHNTSIETPQNTTS